MKREDENSCFVVKSLILLVIGVIIVIIIYANKATIEKIFMIKVRPGWTVGDIVLCAYEAITVAIIAAYFIHVLITEAREAQARKEGDSNEQSC